MLEQGDGFGQLFLKTLLAYTAAVAFVFRYHARISAWMDGGMDVEMGRDGTGKYGHVIPFTGRNRDEREKRRRKKERREILRKGLDDGRKNSVIFFSPLKSSPCVV